jgi:hypothetical protein
LAVTDQEPIAAAILTALNTALPAGVDAYDRDDVPGVGGNPGTLPVKSVVIDLSRRSTDVYRVGGFNSAGFFLNVIYRADTVTNCRELRRLANVTLDGQLIGAYGLRFNDETQPIDDDPNWGYSGVDTFTFC